MSKSYTKIRKMQELNRIAENRFIHESRQKVSLVNEGWWDRVKANTAGFFSRFSTFGNNIGAIFSGGAALSPNLEAAYARVRSRATTMQKELDDLEKDLDALFSEVSKEKINQRIEKVGFSKGGQDLQDRMDKLNEGLSKYYEAIAQLKGINEGFLQTVQKA